MAQPRPAYLGEQKYLATHILPLQEGRKEQRITYKKTEGRKLVPGL